MATNIGTLSAKAILDAKGFQDGARKVSQEAKALTVNLRSTFAALDFGGLIFGTNFSTAFSVQGIRQFFAGVSETIDREMELGFLSDRLAMPIENLSSLQSVFQENNVTAEQFAQGMGRLSQAIGQATLGSAEARDNFQALGLDWRQLRDQDFETSFMDVAEALSHVTNRSVQLRMATELFGREGGQRMLRGMQEGAEGLRRAMEDVRGRGGMLTERDLAQLQRADDALDRISTRWSQMWRRASVEMTPVFEQMAQGMERGISLAERLAIGLSFSTTGTTNELTRAREERLRVDLENIMRRFQLFQETGDQSMIQGMDLTNFPQLGQPSPQEFEQGFTSGWVDLLNQMQGLPTNASNPLAPGAPDLEKLRTWQQYFEMVNMAAGVEMMNAPEIEQMGAFSQRINTVQAALDGVNISFGVSAEQLQVMRLRQEALTDKQKEAVGVLQQRADSIDRERDRQAMLRRDADEAQRIFDATRTPQEQFEARIEHLTDLFNRGVISSEDTFRRATQQAFQQSLGGPSPLLGSLSAGGSEAAAILQSAMNPVPEFQMELLNNTSEIPAIAEGVGRMVAEIMSGFVEVTTAVENMQEAFEEAWED